MQFTVAHIVLSLDPGGLERLVIDLVREGQRLGQRVAVVCVERPGTLAARAEEAGAHVLCVDKRPGLRPGIVKPLERIFRRLMPDVVHTHQIGALVYAGPAARRAAVPALVHTEHGKHYLHRRRTRWLGRFGGRYADKFCCVSGDIADEVRLCRIVPERKIAVVRNGINVERFKGSGDYPSDGPRVEGANDQSRAGCHPSGEYVRLRRELGIPSGAKVVGTVGRLSEIKRQDVLLRGFARLVRDSDRHYPSPPPEAQRPALHLLLVGDGPMRAELEQLAGEIGVRELVHFAGYQAQPEKYLRLMDVFALTSRSEGMPLAILEAWAAGVPVVASPVGGIPELVDHGQTGLLFTAFDDAALANCIRRLVDDGHLARHLVDAGLNRVYEEFSLASMSQAYEKHYIRLLAERSAPGTAIGGNSISTSAS